MIMFSSMIYVCFPSLLCKHDWWTNFKSMKPDITIVQVHHLLPGHDGVPGKWSSFASSSADTDNPSLHVVEHDWLCALSPVPIANDCQRPCEAQAPPWQQFGQRRCDACEPRAGVVLQAGLDSAGQSTAVPTSYGVLPHPFCAEWVSTEECCCSAGKAGSLSLTSNSRLPGVRRRPGQARRLCACRAESWSCFELWLDPPLGSVLIILF